MVCYVAPIAGQPVTGDALPKTGRGKMNRLALLDDRKIEHAGG